MESLTMQKPIYCKRIRTGLIPMKGNLKNMVQSVLVGVIPPTEEETTKLYINMNMMNLYTNLVKKDESFSIRTDNANEIRSFIVSYLLAYREYHRLEGCTRDLKKELHNIIDGIFNTNYDLQIQYLKGSKEE